MSFADCVDQSRQYSVKLDIDAIEKTGRQLLAEGRGVDRHMMYQLMHRIMREGFLSVIQIESDAKKPATVHPRSELLSNPPPRLPMFPLIPHSASVVSVSASQLEVIGQHRSLMPATQPRVSKLPVVITEETRLAMQPFTPDLSFDKKLHLLGTWGGQFLLPDGFVTNQGLHTRPYPPTVAPRAATEVHFAGNQKKGRMLILPLAFARRVCRLDGLRFHTSNTTVGAKVDADPPVGRLISDYSHPVGASLMFEGKKDLNAEHFAPIKNPTAADICQLHLNAIHAFPGQEIVVIREDMPSAYNRIRINPAHVTLGGLLFEASPLDMHESGFEFEYSQFMKSEEPSDDEETQLYVGFPLVEWFGSQDSNFHFHLITMDCASRSQARCVSKYGASLTTKYTDDFIGFGGTDAMAQERAEFIKDSESIVGHPATAPSKSLWGKFTDTIGMANDTVAHTIGLTSVMYLKLVCNLFVTIPLSTRVGDLIPIHVMQRMASHAIRCADVVHCMLPYSRGFSACMRGLPESADSAPLYRRAYEDLWMWRVVMQLGYFDTSWLVVPITAPLLLRRQHNEDMAAYWHRQARAADIVAYVDATPKYGNGLGFYVPGMGWNQASIPSLLTLVNYEGEDAERDINLLEFISTITAIVAVVRQLERVRASRGESGRAHKQTHIHVWTDNTACMSWIKRNRALHPLHSFLLQVLTLVSVTFNVIITIGHIPGVVNVYADAASRWFNVTNGEAIRREMNQQPVIPYSESLMLAIKQISSEGLSNTSSLVHAALMALGGVRSLSIA